MNYNSFTINYIKVIIKNLKINFNEENEPFLLSNNIQIQYIVSLQSDLKAIWNSSKSAIELIQKQHDSKIQLGLFGLIDDLDLALRTGFLLGDRIVLIDYIFNRILNKKAESVNIEHLCNIAISLARLLHLAEKGRIVIIPNPFDWNPDSKKIITEVADSKITITIPLLSMLNMLSICKKCHLHPYTIAESSENYAAIIDSQIDHVDIIGKDAGKYAYNGILGSLFSEKLLNETEFSYIKNISINKYFEIISKNKNFHSQYLSYITAGGSLNANNNIDNLRESLRSALKDDKINMLNILKGITTVSSIGSAGIASLVATSVISTPLTIPIAILAVSGSLGALINNSKKDDNIVISLFKDLTKEGKK